MPAGDFDYDQLGHGYTNFRQPDPRLAARIHAALGDAHTVVNVGAGAGSYEPSDRYVLAVEPSAVIRAQRPANAAPAIAATAEALPFDDDAFDAAMAMSTIHQWNDAARGFRELRRVARGPVVVFSFDYQAITRFWLVDYFPDLLDSERARVQPLDWVAHQLGGNVTIEVLPIPLDCTDGFIEAYYGRPEMFLDPAARAAQSAWSFVSDESTSLGLDRLHADLESGAWDERYGHFRSQRTYDGSPHLIVAI